MSFQANKFLNRMFRRIGGLVWDITSGSVGVKTENGIYTLAFEGEGDAARPVVNVNPLDSFGVAIPAFATQKTRDEVSIGDLICGDSSIIGWVVEKLDVAFRVMDHNGNTKTYTPPKVAIMGTQGVLVVQSLLSLTGSAAGAQNFGSMLLPLLVLGGDEGDSKLEGLLPFLLMSSQNAGAPGAAAPAGGMNMMAMLAMTGGLDKLGGKGDIDPMTLMMLSGGFGGGAGAMNPMMMWALAGGLDKLGNSDAPKTLSTRIGPPPLQRI